MPYGHELSIKAGIHSTAGVVLLIIIDFKVATFLHGLPFGLLVLGQDSDRSTNMV
jgi:hypothetical protein